MSFLLLSFSEMWYGVFLWAGVSSLVFHLPAALLALATLRGHKAARFFPLAIMLMAIIGPLLGGVLTSTYLKHRSDCTQFSQMFSRLRFPPVLFFFLM